VADRGTLFLDEIGTMSMDTQAKILRVLQDRKFMHLGGVQEIQADVRIIAATNVDLRQMVKEGKFREDLFYRLNVISIDLPPLRQRREDIPLLVQHFLQKYSEENERPIRRIATEALRPLMSYSWPAMFANWRTQSNAPSCCLPIATLASICCPTTSWAGETRLQPSMPAPGHRCSASWKTANGGSSSTCWSSPLEPDRSGRAFPCSTLDAESEDQTAGHRDQEEEPE